MLLAADVQYDEPNDTALAAAIVFDDWSSEHPNVERTRAHHGLAPYVPGSFFERELPCVLPLITELALLHPIDVVIVDGYVDLGERAGLGRHLVLALAALGHTPAVVGVAKSRYAGASGAIEVRRGTSIHPLIVTAHGMDVEEAARRVQAMHGESRIPTLLRHVDQLARGQPIRDRAT